MNDSEQSTFENTSFYNLFIEHSKRKEISMTDSEQNTIDDMSFYIGEDEDFRASDSIFDSDISETDSESDEHWMLENKYEENRKNAQSERCILDISTMLCESRRTVAPIKSPSNGACQLSDSEFHEKSLRRVETELTMALSETDSVYDDASSHNEPRGYVNNLIDGGGEDACEIRTEIERFELLAQKATKFSPEWFQVKEELVELNMLSNSSMKEEDHSHKESLEVDECSLSSVPSVDPNQSSLRLHSQKKVDDIFLTPIYFSALLVVMAHDPSKRAARFCGTYLGDDCEETMPML